MGICLSNSSFGTLEFYTCINQDIKNSANQSFRKNSKLYLNEKKTKKLLIEALESRQKRVPKFFQAFSTEQISIFFRQVGKK